MTVSNQTNITDTTYNGWENYKTWNVSLWIQNDEGLYNIAREAGDYQTFLNFLNEVGVGYSTPDGVKFADPSLNVVELNEMISEL